MMIKSKGSIKKAIPQYFNQVAKVLLNDIIYIASYLLYTSCTG